MDRRKFVRSGMLGASGVAAAGRSEVVSAAQRGGSFLYSMDDYLARMDAGLARVGEWSIKNMLPEFSGDTAAIDELGRKAFTSLYMTAMFSDLPISEQVRPEVQKRMWAVQETMDEAVADMTSYLRGLDKDALSRVQQTLQADPSALGRVVELVDLEAARTGISDQRRQQTRATIEQAGWRLTHQPPDLLVNEYLDKVEKLDASDVDAEVQRRWLAAKVGEEVFWTIQEEERSKRDQRISRGLKVMGIGLLIFLGGVLVAVAVGDESDGVLLSGAIAGTVGAVTFLVGLIILLVGLGTSEEP